MGMEFFNEEKTILERKDTKRNKEKRERCEIVKNEVNRGP
jgi:hypothetical protein